MLESIKFNKVASYQASYCEPHQRNADSDCVTKQIKPPFREESETFYQLLEKLKRQREHCLTKKTFFEIYISLYIPTQLI